MKTSKTKFITVAIILVVIAVLCAMLLPVINDRFKGNTNVDSLSAKNDSLLRVNDSLLLKVDSLNIKADSLKSVIDTVKKK